MSRINTNVSSLIAQTNLGRSNSQLQTALTRLSTGLRINSGKDDPAGLIASENLGRDITAANKAISNSERAGQMIATADSALSQISGLLNDIRGLVTEAANSGVLSDEQIAANQLQVDSSLDAIDRISQVTTFQGRKLLDGSLDFQTTYSAGGSTVQDLNINQANLGATGSVAVSVDITSAATQALINNTGFSPSTAAQATGTVALTNSAGSINVTATAGGAADGVAGNATDVVFQAATDIAQSTGTFTLSTGTIDLTAAAGGTAYDNLTINIAAATGATSASYNAGTNTLTIAVDDSGSGDTTQDIADAIDAEGTFTTSGVTGGAVAFDPLDSGSFLNQTTGGDDGTTGAAYAGSTITVDVGLNATVNDVASAIDALTDFDATAASGSPNAFDVADYGTTLNPLSGGVDAGVNDVLNADLVVKVAGASGAQVFNFQAGSTVAQVVSAINLVSDSTGVVATAGTGAVDFQSSAYGSNAFVDIEVISEGAGGTFESGLSATRSTGTDVQATVNGFSANGNGNTLSINTPVLDFSLTVDDGSLTDVSFSINGGGAQLQLGPTVVSTEQARIGINSVNTGKLGGVDGRLYQLRSGESAALATDPTTASRITDEAINKITSLRGRFGAFQHATIETNIASLKDTVANLTEAQSSIRDADFAKESAALTRAQILVQSGTAVLQIANQSPQQVLALLRG